MDPLDEEIYKAMGSGDLPEIPSISIDHSADSAGPPSEMKDGESFDSYVERLFQDMPEGGVVEAGPYSPSSQQSGSAEMEEVVGLLRDILAAIQNGLSV
tara:strand:+ start:257 stop:553 length:297 start_codon:yes stop_codon:yes gene_type:complete